MPGKDKFYILLLVMLLVTGFLQFRTNADLDRENAELKALLESNLETSRQNQQLGEDIAELQGRLSGITAALEQYIADPDSPREGQAGAADAAPAAAGNGFEAVALNESRDKSLNELRIERMQTPEAMDLLARDTVQSQYGAFIRSLNLDPAEEEELFQLMVDEVKKRLFLPEQLAAGEITREEYARLTNPRSLYSTLGNYLTDDEMDAFAQYQGDAPVRAHATVEANQYFMLGNGAPGLTDANRAQVATVLADVMTNRQNQYLMQNAEGMAELFQEARMRLEGSLDEEQMQIVSDFLDRQAKMRELWEQ